MVRRVLTDDLISQEVCCSHGKNSSYRWPDITGSVLQPRWEEFLQMTWYHRKCAAATVRRVLTDDLISQEVCCSHGEKSSYRWPDITGSVLQPRWEEFLQMTWYHRKCAAATVRTVLTDDLISQEVCCSHGENSSYRWPDITGSVLQPRWEQFLQMTWYHRKCAAATVRTVLTDDLISQEVCCSHGENSSYRWPDITGSVLQPRWEEFLQMTWYHRKCAAATVRTVLTDDLISQEVCCSHGENSSYRWHDITGSVLQPRWEQFLQMTWYHRKCAAATVRTVLTDDLISQEVYCSHGEKSSCRWPDITGSVLQPRWEQFLQMTWYHRKCAAATVRTVLTDDLISQEVCCSHGEISSYRWPDITGSVLQPRWEQFLQMTWYHRKCAAATVRTVLTDDLISQEVCCSHGENSSYRWPDITRSVLQPRWEQFLQMTWYHRKCAAATVRRVLTDDLISQEVCCSHGEKSSYRWPDITGSVLQPQWEEFLQMTWYHRKCAAATVRTVLTDDLISQEVCCSHGENSSYRWPNITGSVLQPRWEQFLQMTWYHRKCAAATVRTVLTDDLISQEVCCSHGENSSYRWPNITGSVLQPRWEQFLQMTWYHRKCAAATVRTVLTDDLISQEVCCSHGENSSYRWPNITGSVLQPRWEQFLQMTWYHRKCAAATVRTVLTDDLISQEVCCSHGENSSYRWPDITRSVLQPRWEQFLQMTRYHRKCAAATVRTVLTDDQISQEVCCSHGENSSYRWPDITGSVLQPRWEQFLQMTWYHRKCAAATVRRVLTDDLISQEVCCSHGEKSSYRWPDITGSVLQPRWEEFLQMTWYHRKCAAATVRRVLTDDLISQEVCCSHGEKSSYRWPDITGSVLQPRWEEFLQMTRYHRKCAAATVRRVLTDDQISQEVCCSHGENSSYRWPDITGSVLQPRWEQFLQMTWYHRKCAAATVRTVLTDDLISQEVCCSHGENSSYRWPDITGSVLQPRWEQFLQMTWYHRKCAAATVRTVLTDDLISQEVCCSHGENSSYRWPDITGSVLQPRWEQFLQMTWYHRKCAAATVRTVLTDDLISQEVCCSHGENSSYRWPDITGSVLQPRWEEFLQMTWYHRKCAAATVRRVLTDDLISQEVCCSHGEKSSYRWPDITGSVLQPRWEEFLQMTWYHRKCAAATVRRVLTDDLISQEVCCSHGEKSSYRWPDITGSVLQPRWEEFLQMTWYHRKCAAATVRRVLTDDLISQEVCCSHGENSSYRWPDITGSVLQPRWEQFLQMTWPSMTRQWLVPKIDINCGTMFWRLMW